MFEQVRPDRGGDRARRRGQVEQPARVDREPAHQLQCGGRVLLPHPNARVVFRLNDAPAAHVGDVEDFRVAAARDVRQDGAGVDWEGPGRLVIDLGRLGPIFAVNGLPNAQLAGGSAAGGQAGQGLADSQCCICVENFPDRRM
jgi:hypothetical protein